MLPEITLAINNKVVVFILPNNNVSYAILNILDISNNKNLIKFVFWSRYFLYGRKLPQGSFSVDLRKEEAGSIKLAAYLRIKAATVTESSKS
ncbi:MAG: hypothetical protein M3421_14020 [Bacteroidota bacterium]|nr:hypothetical protein [Bacteroidota bacterium]